MKIYIISDTHFEHERMSEHCGRPKGFEYKILNAIAHTVKPDDILINLGDFCWHRDAYWHEQYMLYARCRNWLVIGNHDGKTATWYLSHGWAWAGDQCSITYQGKNLLFSHKPMPDSGYDWNIHGHFHNTSRREQLEAEPEMEKILSDKHILIALEKTNYQPIELSLCIKQHEDNLIRVLDPTTKRAVNLVYTAEELKKWWRAYCPECGWQGLSRDCINGQLADTGDYSDPVCPDCFKEEKFVKVVDLD